MTLAYYRYKAKSNGQTHYFWITWPGGMYGATDDFYRKNAEKMIPNKIRHFLQDEKAEVEPCLDWEEWDNVPRNLKHVL